MAEDSVVKEEQIAADSCSSFSDMELSRVLLHRITNEIGLKRPTDVQCSCIPPILKGKNCLARSPTGSGKTMAFAIPMIHRWALDPFGIFGVILTPTRELAHQIKDQFELLGGSNLKISVIIGGIDMQTQALELQERPHFIVATPGRLADHMATGGKNIERLFKNTKFLVYDEADRMLDGQFDDQLKVITASFPKKKQTLMFSATMTEDLLVIAKVLASDEPYVYNYLVEAISSPLMDHKNLTQKYIMAPSDFKDAYMMEVLRLVYEKEFPETIRSLIIFVSTCRECQVVSMLLNDMSFKNVALHSHMSQKLRQNSLVQFRSGLVQTLVATDVVSRGLDIKQVDLIINYNVPMPPDYVHRVGRSGRGGHKSFSLVLLCPRDIRFLHNVENYTGVKHSQLEIDDGNVMKILTDVQACKKIADLKVEEDNPFEDRKNLNKRKKGLLEEVDLIEGNDEPEQKPVNRKMKLKTKVKSRGFIK